MNRGDAVHRRSTPIGTSALILMAFIGGGITGAWLVDKHDSTAQ
jgi:hypothetical protein